MFANRLSARKLFLWDTWREFTQFEKFPDADPAAESSKESGDTLEDWQ